MYTYEFIRISSGMSGWGPLGGNKYGTEDHIAVITDMAQKGWRYVGFIPVEQRGTGHIEQMDLIFEKEV